MIVPWERYKNLDLKSPKGVKTQIFVSRYCDNIVVHLLGTDTNCCSYYVS